MKIETYTVDKHNAGLRIDAYLADKSNLSRSFIQKLIKSGNVLVCGKPVKPDYKIKPGDKIKILIPKPERLELEPEDIPLDIIYEDKDILVINKSKGIAVHPGAGIKKGTLVSALLAHCKDLSGIGGVERPGIVHRLDKDTSGALVVAKNDRAHLHLSAQFAGRKILKIYLALVHGVPSQKEGIIDKPIGRHPVHRKKMAVTETGRHAKTEWKVIKKFNVGTDSLHLSLLEVRIFTGRTHQIRVHLSSIGHPIAGDRVYCKKSGEEILGLESQFLHAYKIGFIHPVKDEYMEFTAKLPSELEKVLTRLKGFS